MAAAVEAVNTVAPEHLELHCKDAMGLLGGIRNAGAIFVGAWAPSHSAITSPVPTTRCRPAARPCSPTRFRSKSSLSARASFLYARRSALGRSDAAPVRGRGPVGARAIRRSASPRAGAGRGCLSAASLAAADLTKVAWPGDAVTTVAEGVDLAAAAGGAAGATGGETNMARTHAAHEGARPALLAGIEPYDLNFTPRASIFRPTRNTYPVPAGVREAVDAAPKRPPLNRYPDSMSNDLRDELAAWHGVARENICAGNGGDELLYNYLLAFGGAGRTLLNCPPCFSEYAFFASLCQTEVRDVWR